MKKLLILLSIALTTMAGELGEKECDSITPDFKTTYVGFGGVYTDMDALNSGLTGNARPTLDNAVFQFSFGENGHYDQVIFGGMFTGHVWRIAENDNMRTLQGAFDFSAIAGYDLIGKEKVSLYPFAGAGFGWIFHRMSLKDEPYDDISSGVSQHDETLWQMSFNLKTGMGFDFRPHGTTRSPVFGVRCGYNFDVSSGSRWYRGFSTVSNAPSFKMSGPFAEVTFGFASKNGSTEEE